MILCIQNSVNNPVDLVGKYFWDFIHPMDWVVVSEAMYKAKTENKAKVIVYRAFIVKDNRYRRFRCIFKYTTKHTFSITSKVLNFNEKKEYKGNVIEFPVVIEREREREQTSNILAKGEEQ